MSAELAGPTAADVGRAAKPRPLRMGFVKLVVEDLEPRAAFYGEALGLEVLRRIAAEGVTELVLGRPGSEADLRLVLVQHTEPKGVTLGSAYGAIGLLTDNVDDCYDRALSAGAAPQRPPFDFPGGRAAFVLDPDGREIEFLYLRPDR